MITEPEYWKSEIFNCAVSLRDKIDQKRWPAVSVAHLEKTLMSACYGARKLSESGYVDDEKFHKLIPVRVHDALGNGVTSDSWKTLDLHYNFVDYRQEKKEFSFICNQIIHSFIFIPVLRSELNKGLHGIAFNSDRSERIHSIMLILGH